MANTINKYFTTIGPSLAVNMTDPLLYNGPIINHLLNDVFYVKNDELYKILFDIDIMKSSPIEHVKSRILKDAFICLITQLKCVLNLSFSTGTFPDDWENVTITPLKEFQNFTPFILSAKVSRITHYIVYS